VDKYLEDLDQLQGTQTRSARADPLKNQLEELFSGRTGAPQETRLHSTRFTRREQRYKLRIPPGFQDAARVRDDEDAYTHRGLIYKRRFGDYVIWHQLLAYTKQARKASVIFVTDDAKDDWWLRIDSGGPKTMGPRPELMEEARLIGGVDTLLLYKPADFLKYASEIHEQRRSLTAI
jgi:hypothetical protein